MRPEANQDSRRTKLERKHDLTKKHRYSCTRHEDKKKCEPDMMCGFYTPPREHVCEACAWPIRGDQDEYKVSQLTRHSVLVRNSFFAVIAHI